MMCFSAANWFTAEMLADQSKIDWGAGPFAPWRINSLTNDYIQMCLASFGSVWLLLVCAYRPVSDRQCVYSRVAPHFIFWHPCQKANTSAACTMTTTRRYAHQQQQRRPPQCVYAEHSKLQGVVRGRRDLYSFRFYDLMQVIYNWNISNDCGILQLISIFYTIGFIY